MLIDPLLKSKVDAFRDRFWSARGDDGAGVGEGAGEFV